MYGRLVVVQTTLHTIKICLYVIGERESLDTLN